MTEHDQLMLRMRCLELGFRTAAAMDDQVIAIARSGSMAGVRPTDPYEVTATIYQHLLDDKNWALRDGDDSPDEATLSRMMRDPLYWRDRNPDIIAKVEAGFRRLHPAG